MNARITSLVVAVAAVGTLALPAAAASAAPVPDPPPRMSLTADMVRAVIDELADVYRTAPLGRKLGIHEEIVLLVNIGRAAL